MNESPDSSHRLEWRTAEVVHVAWETKTVRTLTLDVPGWPGHRAGQHVDVRLTAEDGYRAERSYSIASAPETARLALTVERLDDGEVSPYLTEELRVGDGLELRGPIGGYFAWDASIGGPLFLVAGGSGIVPLMAMLRHRAAALEKHGAGAGTDLRARLLYSSRSWQDVIYRDELAQLGQHDDTLTVSHTLTRATPERWTGYHRRIDEAMLADVAWSPDTGARTFICGPTPMVESVASALVGLGHAAASIRTERFGPTG